MPTITVSALPESARRMAAKTPIGSRLRTAEWAKVPLALRERAQFSAAVESVRLLTAVQTKLLTRVNMLRETIPPSDTARGGEAFVDRSSFIGDLRKIAQEEGLGTGAGGVTDVRSRTRLGLIYDIQTRQASEFARWKVGEDPDVLNAYPAQELIREEHREAPRNWKARWTAAGGRFYQGRMIALKSDPVWSAVSRFRTPWPPFDFGSGMGVNDISRSEAEDLGLLEPGEATPPQGERDFNQQLEASVADVPPEMRDWLRGSFGDQITIAADRVYWSAQEPPPRPLPPPAPRPPPPPPPTSTPTDQFELPMPPPKPVDVTIPAPIRAALQGRASTAAWLHARDAAEASYAKIKAESAARTAAKAEARKAAATARAVAKAKTLLEEKAEAARVAEAKRLEEEAARAAERKAAEERRGDR